MVQPGFVEPLNTIRHEQIAIGDHAGDGAVVADACNDIVEFRMKQRLATGDGDDGCAQASKVIDAAAHLGNLGRLRDVVKLVAVGAGQIAAAHRHDMSHVRMRGIQQRSTN